MVVLPLALWEEIQDQLEDLEISKSRYLKKAITQSRREIAAGKGISLSYSITHPERFAKQCKVKNLVNTVTAWAIIAS
ncbi:MAG: hypothetical protein HYV33_06440 [Candidatus Kerfeldbacteria bacterium]|nr:hypothetical protein [Candidatus Kerfeldbacteria bacterium]